MVQNMDILPVSHLLCPSAGNIPYTTVSSKTLATYVFAISRLPGHLEPKMLTFSWSPLNSDVKTVLILIPSIKFYQINTLRRENIRTVLTSELMGSDKMSKRVCKAYQTSTKASPVNQF